MKSEAVDDIFQSLLVESQDANTGIKSENYNMTVYNGKGQILI